MLEATSGLGLILGPIIGSSIYTLMGFQGTFYVLGALCIPFSICVKILLDRKFAEIVASRERNQESLLPTNETLEDGNRTEGDADE